MKLIDKDALIEEINRIMFVFIGQKSQREATQIDRLSLGARIAMLEELKVFLNTLEVREVDLEKENIIGTLERAVRIDAGGYPYINCDIEFYDYDKDIPLAKEGDIVKVVLIKGE